jgi:hypothetical protein
MIAECLIILGTMFPTNGVMTPDMIQEYKYCQDVVPDNASEHFDLIQEFFEPINWDTAVRVSWCESRHNSNALRTAEGNYDSGYFQFVSWTWNWVAEIHDLPMWNDTVITYRDRPWTLHPKHTKEDLHNYEVTKAQFSPYYNILMASLLVEETYSYVRWDDWSSSSWCWEDINKFNRLVAREKNM